VPAAGYCRPDDASGLPKINLSITAASVVKVSPDEGALGSPTATAEQRIFWRSHHPQLSCADDTERRTEASAPYMPDSVLNACQIGNDGRDQALCIYGNTLLAPFDVLACVRTALSPYLGQQRHWQPPVVRNVLLTYQHLAALFQTASQIPAPFMQVVDQRSSKLMVSCSLVGRAWQLNTKPWAISSASRV